MNVDLKHADLATRIPLKFVACVGGVHSSRNAHRGGFTVRKAAPRKIRNSPVISRNSMCLNSMTFADIGPLWKSARTGRHTM